MVCSLTVDREYVDHVDTNKKNDGKDLFHHNLFKNKIPMFMNIKDKHKLFLNLFFRKLNILLA
jgi:hypothetical protein